MICNLKEFTVSQSISKAFHLTLRLATATYNDEVESLKFFYIKEKSPQAFSGASKDQKICPSRPGDSSQASL